jgi:hypothetical protein
MSDDSTATYSTDQTYRRLDELPVRVDVSARFDLSPATVTTSHSATYGRKSLTIHLAPGRTMETEQYNRGCVPVDHVRAVALGRDTPGIDEAGRPLSESATDCPLFLIREQAARQASIVDRTRPRQSPAAAPVATTLARYDMASVFADGLEEEWILEPLLLKGGGTQIQSAPGDGKSLLAADIVMALANADRYVLGVKATRTYKVVYLDFENEPRRDWRRWLRNLGYDDDGRHFENVFLCSMPSIAALNTPEGGALVVKTAKEFGADLVVVDTVGRAVDGDENDASTFLDYYRHLGMPLKREGIATLRLDHIGKDSSKGARGSSAKSGDVDLVWEFRRSDAATYRLVNTKQRIPIAETHMAVNRVSEVWEGNRLVSPLEHRVEVQVTEHAGRVTALVDALDEADIPEGASVRATTDAVRDVLQLHAKNDVIRDAVKVRKSRTGARVEDQDDGE